MENVSSAEIEAIVLRSGAHVKREAGVCAMEMVAWMAGEPHSDRPVCACPVASDFVRRWNDQLQDGPRQRLKPFLPRMIWTANDGLKEKRAWMIVDWAIREAAPYFFDIFKELKTHAVVLRELPVIQDEAALLGAQPKIAEAIKAAQSLDALDFNLDLFDLVALALERAVALTVARAETEDAAAFENSLFALLERMLPRAPKEASYTENAA